MLELTCEVKEVKAKKLASLDMSYRIILETNDPSALQLGTIEGDELVNVKIEGSNG
jgi:hypothetical protein